MVPRQAANLAAAAGGGAGASFAAPAGISSCMGRGLSGGLAAGRSAALEPLPPLGVVPVAGWLAAGSTGSALESEGRGCAASPASDADEPQPVSSATPASAATRTASREDASREHEARRSRRRYDMKINPIRCAPVPEAVARGHPTMVGKARASARTARCRRLRSGANSATGQGRPGSGGGLGPAPRRASPGGPTPRSPGAAPLELVTACVPSRSPRLAHRETVERAHPVAHSRPPW